VNAAKITRLHRDQPPSLLLAEDDALSRCSVADELRDQGFRVFEASSARDALSILRTFPVHVMVVDIDISGRGEGVELARFARTLRPSPKVVFALEQEHGEMAPEVAALGAFVNKPYVLSELVRIVRQGLATGGDLPG
jgi:two-component system, response regulator PdtaR